MARAMPSATRPGNSSGPRLRPGAVAERQRAGLDDMAERVGALVAKILSILGAAAAERIEEKNRAPHSGAYWFTTAETRLDAEGRRKQRAWYTPTPEARRTLARLALSTTLPCRITMSSLASALTTLRSCEMNI